jgi:transketolase
MRKRMKPKNQLQEHLEAKARWVWQETLRIHMVAPDTRIASSLSSIEIFVALYYGKILNFDPMNPLWEKRDRMIISKGHGSISMYPILADLGFFDKNQLKNVGQEGSILGSIPDPIIPGYETINGSLGHGAGVGCGIALALKHQKSPNSVFIVLGDGELYEGANWEAFMFAAHNHLDNLNIIIDHNKISMLGLIKNILDYGSLNEKLKAFGWETAEVDGHQIIPLCENLENMKNNRRGKPKALIAHTIKGKGVKELEQDPLCHVQTLDPKKIHQLLKPKE